ncbi:hypothetical protein AGMMS49531_10070 [Endomicrobiia bacterium]|nr:hypothetical protein AGMMS49531_10070 [Endomicrobiia bacterium]
MAFKSANNVAILATNLLRLGLWVWDLSVKAFGYFSTGGGGDLDALDHSRQHRR